VPKPTGSSNSHRYIKIDDTLYNSVAFKTLSVPALKLWLDLRTQFNGSNNGTLVATLSRLRHRAWTSNSTLTRALRELVERGLLRYTRRSGRNVFHRASMFAFTDLPVPDNERHGIASSNATHDYVEWVPQQRHAKKRAHRDRVSNDPGARCDKTPSGGDQVMGTVPLDGEREIVPNPAPGLDLHPMKHSTRALTVSR